MDKKLKIAVIVLISVMAAAIIVAGTVIGVTYSKLEKLNEALAAEGHSAAIMSDSKDKAIVTLGDEKDRLSSENDRLNSEKDQLADQNSELSAEISEKEAKIKTLEDEITNLEALLSGTDKAYVDEMHRLKGEIASREADIAQLKSDIDTYSKLINVDFRRVSALMDELESYIENNAPYAKKIFEDGSYQWFPISQLIAEERILVSEEGTVLYTEEELLSSGLTASELEYNKLKARLFERDDIGKLELGLYYEDIFTGYRYGYNEKTRFGYASVIKAPYVLAVLEAVSADEQAYLDSLAAEGLEPEYIDTDGDGEPDTLKIEYSDPKYDLSESVAYNPSTMYRDGSGIIKTSPEGTEYTYLDFVKYAVMYSDNVAYSRLRARFDYSIMYALANRLGVSIYDSSMSAEGAGRMFREIWKFIDTNERYGPVLYEAMTNTNHRVITPLALPYKTVLNKYGWDDDNYNDAAIVVSGTRPYVVTLFTNLNFHNDLVDPYLREIIRKIDAIHSEFTAGK